MILHTYKREFHIVCLPEESWIGSAYLKRVEYSEEVLEYDGTGVDRQESKYPGDSQDGGQHGHTADPGPGNRDRG